MDFAEEEKKMGLKELMDQIAGYLPWSEEELREKQQILQFMEKNPDCLFRSNEIAHMTASAWIVNPRRTKVVMAYHNIYHSWAWLGGHADGEADLLKVAKKRGGGRSGPEIFASCDGRNLFSGIADCGRPSEKRSLGAVPSSSESDLSF